MRMLDALARAKSVHVTGWTRQAVRKWPLEHHGDQPAGAGEVQDKLPVEAWYWTEEDGGRRAYERQGPVYLVRRGEQLREYQSDVPLTFLFESQGRTDKLARFAGLASYLCAAGSTVAQKSGLGSARSGWTAELWDSPDRGRHGHGLLD